MVSQQGTRGGYVLGRDPSKISIVDVIEALDGPIGITPCERGSSCEQTGTVLRKGSADGCTGKDGSGAGRYLDLRIGRITRPKVGNDHEVAYLHG